MQLVEPDRVKQRMDNIHARVKDSIPSFNTSPRFRIVAQGAVILTLLMVFTVGPVAAQQTTFEGQAELLETFKQIGNFISIIVLGVAIPNGAYGFLQYMTAGSNVEKDEKGRERIRNTFIALAGVALIQIAVQGFAAIAGVPGA